MEWRWFKCISNQGIRGEFVIFQQGIQKEAEDIEKKLIIIAILEILELTNELPDCSNINLSAKRVRILIIEQLSRRKPKPRHPKNKIPHTSPSLHNNQQPMQRTLKNKPNNHSQIKPLTKLNAIIKPKLNKLTKHS